MMCIVRTSVSRLMSVSRGVKAVFDDEDRPIVSAHLWHTAKARPCSDCTHHPNAPTFATLLTLAACGCGVAMRFARTRQGWPDE
jgi:hypothetical protein